MIKRHLHPAAESGAPDEPADEHDADPSVADDEPPVEVVDEAEAELAQARAAAASAAAWYQSRIATLQGELASRDEKLREYIAAYKAAVGEMEAVRERLERDKDKVIDRDRKDLVGKLLDLLDNFDRSLGSIRPNTSVEDIVHGLTMVRTQFSGVLSGFGVERMQPVGRDFDATQHEAAAMVPAQASQRDQEVIFEERAGYLYKGELLRAARVIVANRPD